MIGDPRQAAIDALAEAYVRGRSDAPSVADTILDYLDAHPEAAAALRAYLAPEVARLERALRVSTHRPHDQSGEPVEGFPVCSVCGAIQTDLAPGDDLGTAWAEAEAALPDGWHLGSLLAPVIAPWGGLEPHEWEAHALDCNGATRRARGPTPAAALRALTARLKEANRE